MNQELSPRDQVPIRECVAAISEGRMSASALIEQAQAACDAYAHLNPLAWADWDAAKTVAAERDREARQGRLRGPLHGIPLSVKDLFHVDHMPLRAGTRAALPDIGPQEALAVRRLRAAGAVIFGKANMHEIALGATGENLWTGDVKNPHDAARQSGGSSSGSGVCVATGIGMASLGSDTGGSIRIPASFCGVVGFKPSFGAIPLAGALHLSWTCDHAGPITRCVDDAALLFNVMAERAPKALAAPRRPRFAVPRAWLEGRLHDDVRQPFERLLTALREVADVVDVATPNLPQAFDCYTVIVRVEAAFVHRAALAAGDDGFSRLVVPGLQGGMKIAAVDYLGALRQRELLRAELEGLLDGYDAMLAPTSAIPVPLRGQDEVDVNGRMMTVREAVLGQTLPFSLCGLPALSLPLARAAGMPLGIQAIGRSGADAALLAVGQWLHQSFSEA